MRRHFLALAVSLPPILFAPASARAELIAASSIADALYTLNPTTGQATLLVIPQSGDFGLVGVGLLGGSIYVSNTNLPPTSTVRVDRTTGTVTPVIDQELEGGSNSWTGLTANRNAGLLYTTQTGSILRSLNPATGIVSTIGEVGPATRGLAYNNLTNTLYGITTTGELYTINTTTGTPTLIGDADNLSTASRGLGFDEETGTLFMTADPDGNGALLTNLYTLDLTTGAATLVGSTGINLLGGLDWQPVPEPATLALFGLALAGLAHARRRPQKS